MKQKGSDLIAIAEQNRYTGGILIYLKDGGLSDFEIETTKKNHLQVSFLLDKIAKNDQIEKKS